jgi:GT2 family glycosyltransferase
MYAEDLDIGWRLHAAGYEMVYEPGARVLHEVSAATRQAFVDDREERHIAAAYAWMARRRGIWSAWSYAAVNAAGSWIRALFLAVAARANPARYAGRRDLARYYVSLHRLGLRRGAHIIDAVPDSEPGGG